MQRTTAALVKIHSDRNNGYFVVQQLFLDSDGVLFDFNAHVLRLSGGISADRLGDEPLWALVATIPDFWLSMPLLPWAEALVAATRPWQPRVLTGCPRNGYALAVTQKTAVFARYFPGLEVITCLTREKTNYLTAPGDVLLDDRQKNIRRWAKAGGTPVRFRRFDQAVADLTEIFAPSVAT